MTQSQTKNRRLSLKHIGESKQMKNGLVATIIAYRGTNDIDIQFADGTVVTNRRYDSFVKQNIGKRNEIPTLRLGETSLMKNGMIAKIIGYNNAFDITIEFENGVSRDHVNYAAFRKGRVSEKYTSLEAARKGRTKEHQENRTGMTKELRDGTVTITEYNSCLDCNLEFSNGAKKLHVPYRTFLACKTLPKTSEESSTSKE